MWFDLSITSLKNLWFIDSGMELNWALFFNIGLAISFLVGSLIAVILLIKQVLNVIRKKKSRDNNSVYETFASLNLLSSAPRIIHLLAFSVTRMSIALLICLSTELPAMLTSVLFLGIVSVSFLVQIPLKIFTSPFMNLLNLVMEFSLVFIGVTGVIHESINLSESASEALGLITVIVLLLF